MGAVLLVKLAGGGVSEWMPVVMDSNKVKHSAHLLLLCHQRLEQVARPKPLHQLETENKESGSFDGNALPNAEYGVADLDHQSRLASHGAQTLGWDSRVDGDP